MIGELSAKKLFDRVADAVEGIVARANMVKHEEVADEAGEILGRGTVFAHLAIRQTTPRVENGLCVGVSFHVFHMLCRIYRLARRVSPTSAGSCRNAWATMRFGRFAPRNATDFALTERSSAAVAAREARAGGGPRHASHGETSGDRRAPCKLTCLSWSR